MKKFQKKFGPENNQFDPENNKSDFHSTRKLIPLSSIIHARQKKKDKQINNQCEKCTKNNQENAPISEKERT